MVKDVADEREDEDIKEILTKITDEYNIEYIEVFSFDVFPSLYTHNQKNYLVWDTALWNAVKNFIAGYIVFDRAASNSDVSLMQMGHRLMSMMIAFYLSLKYYSSNKVLACNFALQYSMMLDLYANTFKLLDMGEEAADFISDFLMIAKIYCSYHEIAHLIFRNSINNNNDFGNLNKEIEMFFTVVDISSDDSFAYNYGISKSEMLSYYNQKKNDSNLREEMFCDRYAAEKTFDKILELKQDRPVQINLAKCLETYERFTYFFTLLMTTEHVFNIFSDETDGLISEDEANTFIKNMRAEHAMRMAINETFVRLMFFTRHPHEYACVDGFFYTNKDTYSEYKMSLVFEDLFYSSGAAKEKMHEGNKYVLSIGADLEEIFTSVFNL